MPTLQPDQAPKEELDLLQSSGPRARLFARAGDGKPCLPVPLPREKASNAPSLSSERGTDIVHKCFRCRLDALIVNGGPNMMGPGSFALPGRCPSCAAEARVHGLGLDEEQRWRALG
eukprot:scaffold680_cov264-Pinguiococcus_pyrenoidosus.AAC.22